MCHHRHRRYEREVERLAAPSESIHVSSADRAVQPTAGPIRVADADRERVAGLLRDHAAAGRLEPDEFEERLERAYAARYGSDLESALAELPAQPAPRGRGANGVAGTDSALSGRRRHRTATAPLLPLAIGVLIALAAATSAWWLLWLIWPIVIVLGPRRHYRRAARF
jgi:uncharacterized protein DUF1707